MQEWEGLTIGSLLPGMLVNVKVRNVLSDGLLVSFLTFFNGTIDCFHLTQVPIHSSLQALLAHCRMEQKMPDLQQSSARHGPAHQIGLL